MNLEVHQNTVGTYKNYYENNLIVFSIQLRLSNVGSTVFRSFSYSYPVIARAIHESQQLNKPYR